MNWALLMADLWAMTITIAIGGLVLVIMVAFLPDRGRCWLGLHEWYTSYLCRSTGAKRLPGDSVHWDWQRPQEEVGFRYERHCICCRYEEYRARDPETKQDHWLPIPQTGEY